MFLRIFPFGVAVEAVKFHSFRMGARDLYTKIVLRGVFEGLDLGLSREADHHFSALGEATKLDLSFFIEKVILSAVFCDGDFGIADGVVLHRFPSFLPIFPVD